jgi:hypothetical protein
VEVDLLGEALLGHAAVSALARQNFPESLCELGHGPKHYETGIT